MEHSTKTASSVKIRGYKYTISAGRVYLKSINMTFTSETLTYKAYTYSSKNDPIHVTNQHILLVKKGDEYTVPSNKILVKVDSAALNPVDLMLYNSAIFPFTLMNSNQGIGRDYSGVVEAIGSGDDLGLKVGDKVCGLYLHPLGKGTVAEYILLDGKTDVAVNVIPSNLSLTEASSWPLVYGTAFAMHDGVAIKDKKVLVLGAATSVGRYVVSLAKKYGAKEIVTTNSERSLDLVAALGSTSQIDYTKHKSILTPVLESVKDSGSFDAVFDCCGGNDLFPQAKVVISPKGTYTSIAGDKKYTYAKVSFFNNTIPLTTSMLRSIGSRLGLFHYTYRFLLCKPEKRWMIEGKKFIEEEHVKVFVDGVYKFGEFDKALDRLKSNKANGKILIDISNT